MEWRSDVGPARTGDSEARERLREYLTPFVHAVCLAHAPYHLTFSLVPHSLEAALNALVGVDDADVAVHAMNVARRLSKEVMHDARLEELASRDAAVNVALSAVGRLRELDPTLRERFFLRMLEGIPGPELAEVARLNPGELRAELERAAGEASRLLGQAQSLAGDEYLWELSGAPSALLARLEMQLPVLRFDPLAVPPTLASADTAGTQRDLEPVGGPAGQVKSLTFDLADITSVGDVATAPGEPGTSPVVAVAPQPRIEGPNPFEPQVRTLAATDLPAEAKGNLQVPGTDPAPSGSKSGKLQPLPARPVPGTRESGELGGKSGKSVSGKSGRQAQVEESGKKGLSSSGKFPIEVTKDAPKLTDDTGVEATEAKVPAAIARQAVVPDPEGVLGKPTMELSLADAVQGPTRLNPLIITNLETRVAEAQPSPVQPAPSLADAQILKGGSPFFLMALFALVGTGLWAASLFATERQSKASWTLTQVVVAAEDMNVGDVVNIENVAVRSVPEPFQGSNVIKSDAMNFILDQKLAVAVQAGDPLFYSQFISMRAQRSLATRISKRGRGYTLSTSAVTSVGRWVRPGDLVDLIVTLNALDTRDPKAKGKSKEPRAVTILQHVRVLATGKSDDDSDEATLDERDRQYGDVTLMLTPPEAEVLALASELGKVSLTLRNQEDNEVDLERGFTNIKTLLEGDRVRVLQKKRFALIKMIRNASPEAARKNQP
jgi:pilus assembly protein CpaB